MRAEELLSSLATVAVFPWPEVFVLTNLVQSGHKGDCRVLFYLSVHFCNFMIVSVFLLES
jgi:hypothetical protein